MIRFTADTNIYISSFNFGGVPKAVLILARKGEAVLSVSEFILQEITRTLRDKFAWSEFAIYETEADILSYAKLVTPSVHIEAVKDDPTDNRILECAVASHSEYIVTGDKHLLRLGQLGEIRIVTPAEFLAITAQAT